MRLYGKLQSLRPYLEMLQKLLLLHEALKNYSTQVDSSTFENLQVVKINFPSFCLSLRSSTSVTNTHLCTVFAALETSPSSFLNVRHLHKLSLPSTVVVASSPLPSPCCSPPRTTLPTQHPLPPCPPLPLMSTASPCLTLGGHLRLVLRLLQLSMRPQNLHLEERLPNMRPSLLQDVLLVSVSGDSPRSCF